MAEYIEREALVSDLEFLARHQDGFRQSVILGVVHTINCVPAADVAPVVRCFECVLSGNCTAEDTFRLVAGIENPFCCVGKRKDGES